MIRKIEFSVVTLYHYITTGKYNDYEIWASIPIKDEDFKGILFYGTWDLTYSIYEIIEFYYFCNRCFTKEISNKIGNYQNLKVLFGR